MSSTGDHGYGVYGEAIDAELARLEDEGNVKSLTAADYRFRDINKDAIQSAALAWDRGLTALSIPLWWDTQDSEGVITEFPGGWHALHRQWSLVLSSLVNIGWRVQSWQVQMNQGDRHHAVALLGRP